MTRWKPRWGKSQCWPPMRLRSISWIRTPGGQNRTRARRTCWWSAPRHCGLTWLRALGSRQAAAITAALSFFTGFLISDGYSACQQLLPQLAGVQQCCQHVIRRCRAVTRLGPGSLQSWAADVIDILREAHQAAEEALARGDPVPDAELLAKLRARYDEAAAFGITHNRHRDWHDGNHPGYTLGCWLRDYADQVWLFTRQPGIEWTNDLASYCTSVSLRDSALTRWPRCNGFFAAPSCGFASAGLPLSGWARTRWVRWVVAGELGGPIRRSRAVGMICSLAGVGHRRYLRRCWGLPVLR
jgi:Transposase IS66 family